VTGTSITFECPLPPWLVILTGLCALGVVAVFVFLDVAALRRSARAVIIGCALIALIMLIGILLNPKLIRKRPDERSMLLEDSYSGLAAAWLENIGNPSGVTQKVKAAREKVARRMLSDAPNGIAAQLKRDFDLSLWKFAGDAKEFTVGDGSGGYSVDPDGYVSAIGEALARAGKAGGGERPRVVVLLSDGAWNSGRDPTEIARMLGRAGTRVFVIMEQRPRSDRDSAHARARGNARFRHRRGRPESAEGRGGHRPARAAPGDTR